jgi:hypothetical protein
MTKYRICVSLLSGLGFVSLLCLLLNIPVVSLLLFALFAPGAIATTLVLRFANWDSNLALFAANVVIYSMVAFVLIILRFRDSEATALRRFAVRMLFPVAAISFLACFSAFNPLVPVGMAELSTLELGLQQAIRPQMRLQDARAVLTAKGVEFNEHLEDSQSLVFQGQDKKITAAVGDRVLVSRFRTSAFNFPCGYDMEVILLFGQDDKLKDQYVRRFPMCP